MKDGSETDGGQPSHSLKTPQSCSPSIYLHPHALLSRLLPLSTLAPFLTSRTLALLYHPPPVSQQLLTFLYFALTGSIVELVQQHGASGRDCRNRHGNERSVFEINMHHVTSFTSALALDPVLSP